MRNINLSKLKSTVAPLVLGIALVSAPAFAQDAVEDEEEATIVVTGSRITQPNLDASSPLTITSSEQIKETGLTRLEDVLVTLPQIEAAQNSFISNGASGVATLDLRGLGPNRTLVLVNGRRLQPGSTNQTAAGYGADINQIPSALVERIDVTTGGASSVYGADAVAGVVNFVMKKDFEGFQLDAGLGYYMHQNSADNLISTLSTAVGYDIPTDLAFDGRQFHVDMLLGSAFDGGRGHATVYATYRKISPVLQGTRDHSACALNRAATACGGSANAPIPNFSIFAFENNDPSTNTEDATSEKFLSLGANNEFVSASGNIYNFGPINYFQRPDERYTLGSFAEYEVSEAFNPYVEVMYMHSRSVGQIAQSGTFFSDLYAIPCQSPLLADVQRNDLCNGGANALSYFVPTLDAAGMPTFDAEGLPIGDSEPLTLDDTFAVFIGKRNVEGGPRRNTLTQDSFRILTGAKGAISNNWNYDASIQYGQSSNSSIYENDFFGPNITDALRVASEDGALVCDNPQPSNSSCVPYLVFQRGAVTSEAAGTLTGTAALNGVIKEFIANGYVTGDLGFSLAQDPIALVLGAEYRKVIFTRISDFVYEQGLLLGQGGPTPSISGNFDVKELFAEASVPLIQDVSFAEDMRLELGYRYSAYSIDSGADFGTHTFKAQLNWKVNEWLRLRGGFNRAVRAPNPVELFRPQGLALWSGEDPCATLEDDNGVRTTDFTAEQCARTGVTAAQYGNVSESPAGQYNQLLSGNLNLNPEKANTITAGVVLTPTPRMSLSVDYYRVKIDDVIGNYPQEQLIRDCGTGVAPEVCSRITRSATGNLWQGQSGFVESFPSNLASRDFQGIDVGAAYRLPLGNGSINLGMSGSYLLKKEYQDLPSTAPYDCAGEFNANCFPSPKWRHTFRVSYQAPSVLTVTAKWRFTSSVNGAAANGATSISSYHWFDLAMTADIGDNYTLTLGANNLFDKDPPLVGNRFATNGNTYAGFYDTLGRYVFIEGSLRF